MAELEARLAAANDLLTICAVVELGNDCESIKMSFLEYDYKRIRDILCGL